MISKEEVQHIAKLARIHLSAKESEKFQKELGEVLDYFEILKEVPTDDVGITTHSVELQNVKRQDKAKVKTSKEGAFLADMAPDKKDGYVKVKSIF